MSPSRVSFHVYDPTADFLTSRAHPTLDQYLAWIQSGAYSVILFDGSLLQLTYDVSGGAVSGHRLAYIPCPYELDLDLLAEGEPIADIVELHIGQVPVLRSPIRFDFDPAAAKPGHPATHMTLNATSCRIGCIAPMHALRFVDFVFRNFYSDLWEAHWPFFESAERRHIGTRTLAETDRRIPHFSWDVHAMPA
ncbi:DUF2290 domain-containing protein [Arthrobacter sp. R4]|uniref:DUF2290 domain-containing protein n=1 Tax=Arthrobacter sp. R4 TaxID=644417 RepID=UPI003ED85119